MWKWPNFRVFRNKMPSIEDALVQKQPEVWMPSHRLGVSNDKAYDLELNHAKQEILARLGFSRQLLGFQLALIAGSSGIIGVALQKPNGIFIEAIAAILVWIVFAVEGSGRVNWNTIVVLSKYIDGVLNRKYRFEAEGQESLKLYEWTDYLDGKHPQSAGGAPSVTSATEILNFILIVIALSAFCYSLCLQVGGSFHNVDQFNGNWLIPWIFSGATIAGMRVNSKWFLRIWDELKNAIRIGENDLSKMPKGPVG